MVPVQGKTILLEVIMTPHAVGGFPDFLDRGQEQTDQHGNDGDDDEQLNQGKATQPTPEPQPRKKHGHYSGS
jgi:hypothetical protein